MSVYKVERIVDTVRVEMDISTAEMLTEILMLVQDNTPGYNKSINDLRVMLQDGADVRYPSPLYRAEVKSGYVELRNTTGDECRETREARGLFG